MVREMSPDTEAYVLYKDIRTPGQYESFYQKAQEDTGIFFTKAEVTGVQNGGGTLKVDAEDTLLGANVQIEADLVVLATGMVPRSADGEQIRTYVDAKKIVEKGEAGAQLENAKEAVEQLAYLEDAEILNLTYRQGPDLPVFKYDFPDSHFICFPYESRRTGIYPAGCVRAPLDAQNAQGGRKWRRPQGHSSHRGHESGRGRAPALGRHVLPGIRPPAVHPVQALH